MGGEQAVPERTVVFSARLYELEAIRSCAERFAGHARIAVAEEGGGFRVTLAAADGDDLLDSFCNHVLFETIRLRRRREAQR